MELYKVPEASRRKLDPKARSLVLLSYLPDGKGYRLWDLERRMVVKSCDVLSDHTCFPYQSGLSKSPPTTVCDLPIVLSEDTPLPVRISTPNLPFLDIQLEPRFDCRLQASIHNIELPSTSPTSTLAPSPTQSPLPPDPPRRTTRSTRQPNRYGNFALSATIPDISDDQVLKTWKQVQRSPHCDHWLAAADKEFKSLLGMETWKLVTRPAKRKIIKSKWALKVKCRVDCSILKLKARLVAMGYTQVKGEDFNDVFFPTPWFETLHLLFTLLESKGWAGRQLNFKTAFLKGKLKDPVYMAQAPGFEDQEHPDRVYELSRSLYGLKQSPREWNKELHAALISLGLTQSKYNPKLYFKLDNGRLVGAITTHVNDLAVVGEPKFVSSIFKRLAECFEVSSDEDLHHFLSIQITQNPVDSLLFRSKEHYIKDLHERFLAEPPVSVSTPANMHFKDLCSRRKGETASPGPYSSLIGALLWVSQCTRDYVAFVVNRLS